MSRETIVWILDESGHITVEVITRTKNGCGYHRDGQLLTRPHMFSRYFVSPTGQCFQIEPVSKFEIPEWADGKRYVITAQAKARYQQWMAGKLGRE
uniref:hypothetical protein n=1 Tax=Thaumasiovibrio occultus TaxID=1891184 RepID=UPI000B353C7B|nr:hypothetical protein [Thaumasiovibrio occultus]